MAFEDIRNERIAKRETLLTKGLDPYPPKTERTHEIADLVKKFSAAMKLKKPIAIAGRIMAKREHGGSTFIDLQDGTGKIQGYLKRDILGDEYDLFFDVADIGDIIQIKGKAFETHRKEKSIEVATWAMLSKSLRPLPEKWHGLQDVEERFRKRYLDLVMNEEVRARFARRSQILRAVRAFFDKEDFMEVETPMFHSIAGGALARPFRTHHNALDIDLYLRIAPELYLKQLLVGGFEKVYEMGKSFRNEGIDASHNPEFTSVEWYSAFWDEEMMMDSVERCFAFILKELGIKNNTVEYDGKEISFGKKFARFDFKELLQRYALISDYDRETRDSLALRARQLGIETGLHESKGKIADEIYKKICRPYVVQPTFIMNHPLDISPLAKKRTAETVRRFQLVAGTLEMVNAFSELNDPLDQRERFEAQEKMGRDGEEESHPLDEAFIETLEYGMPPAAGAGMGIDRLIMFLTDTKNIREVVLFPTMRPRTSE
ncbi:MAG: lysine--tRNA ligase [bacterium]|nr:lysine--tRNA ligase [bacterium]MDZ4285809.1 lysine--tRNA ligase [Candidatus Sungbacteria bacterium]